MGRVLSTLLAIIFFIAVITSVALLSAYDHLPAVTITPTAMPTPTSTPTPRPTVSSNPSPSQPITSIQWSGYTWKVTDYRGGVFTSRNVWVDPDGNLHMKLIYENGTWKKFNLILNSPVDYGTFKWRVNTDVKYIQDSMNGGNPYFMFSPFLYDSNLPQNGNGEIDVEYCKWANPDDQTNCDWTTYAGGHHVESRSIVGPNNDETLTWMPSYVKFEVQGPQQPYMQYTTDSSRSPPVTGTMQFIILIGQWNNAAPPNDMSNYEAEVVLSNFEMIPYSNTSQYMLTPTPLPSVSPTLPPSQPIKFIRWSDNTWEVTDYRGGVFTSRNVWVDPDGNLHMKLIYENGTWHSFNLILNDYVGYGTFKWRIDSDIDNIQDVKDGGNPYLSFSQFLYDNSIPQYSYGEIDVEHYKWGKINCTTNTDWIIWPDDHNVESRHITGSDNDYTLEWMPDRIRFDVQGPEQPYMEYTFTNAARISPATGQMRFIIWIGQRLNAAPPNDMSYYEAEVVMSNFAMAAYVP